MSFEAVVLAGGKGTRLAPFTHVLPKPLLPVDERPILDVVLTQLAQQSCRKVTITLGHLGHLIELYCGNGDRWDLQIDYFRESTPLGTVGALALIESLPAEPFVVMNGDVLTDIVFDALLASHRQSGAELTISSFRRTVRDELGIVETAENGRVVTYREKPEHDFLVSMGIYVMDRSLIQFIPPGSHMDLPDLVQVLLARGRRVHAYLHTDYWLDLGRPDDFARANEEFRTIRGRLGV